MLYAELEIRHSRPVAPTRRVALGELWLPVEPAPGPGGILLAGIVAGFAWQIDDEEVTALLKLIDDLEFGRRIPQPRLRHRFQVDTVGLDRSRHRLVGDGQSLRLDLDEHGHPLPNILGAVYAAGRLSYAVRPTVFRLLRRASSWIGGNDNRLVGYLAGEEAPTLRSRRFAGEERWALDVLGFHDGEPPHRDDINRRFRELVRMAHPDHGGSHGDAGQRMVDLTEAKRILLRAVAI